MAIMLQIHPEMQIQSRSIRVVGLESHEAPCRTYTRWVQFYRNGGRSLSALVGAALDLDKGR